MLSHAIPSPKRYYKTNISLSEVFFLYTIYISVGASKNNQVSWTFGSNLWPFEFVEQFSWELNATRKTEGRSQYFMALCEKIYIPRTQNMSDWVKIGGEEVFKYQVKLLKNIFLPSSAQLSLALFLLLPDKLIFR